MPFQSQNSRCVFDKENFLQQKVIENTSDSGLLLKDIPKTKVNVFCCSLDVIYMQAFIWNQSPCLNVNDMTILYLERHYEM